MATPDDIKAAESIVGVAYTDRERLQILEALESQLLATKARREVTLSNSVPMALRFDPRLPGFQMPADGTPHRSKPQTALPDSDEDIAFAHLPELSSWIEAGVLSSERITSIYLKRIEALDPDLNCFATVTPDIALTQARAMDALLRQGRYLGPLHGIPYGLKDLFDTAGVETAWGAEAFRGRVPDQDATIVGKLRDAGAVLLGKTALGALAYGDLWYGGQTRNPWNIEEGSSGSSAGSAAATAAGLCAFSIGTETLGSITSPSERCGATGLRPTFGRVSRHGAMALCWSLDKVGPICRGVEDTALVLDAINGPDVRDPSSIPSSFTIDASSPISGIRIGYLPIAYAEGATDCDRKALDVVKSLGMSVVEIELPDLPYDALMNIVYAEAAAAFEDLTLSGRDDLLSWQAFDAWPNIFRTARFLSAVDHVQLDRLRYLVMEALDTAFNEVDVIVGPFSTGPMLVASNFTGHPCLHIRAGFEDLPSRTQGSLLDQERSEHGPAPEMHHVPRGLSLWAGLFDEQRLISVGLALEAALKIADVRPVISERAGQ